MKLRVLRFSLSLALVAALAACGGKSRSPAGPGNTSGAGAAGGVPAAWAEVMVEGATFTLANAGEGDNRMIVIGTVTKVTRDGSGAAAELTWKDGSGEDTGNGLPTQIKVSPAGVWFGDPAGPPTFPAGVEETARDGYQNYASPRGDEVCFGEGPGEGAGDCEDVCFAELCVTPGVGISGGAGTWWPNYEVFERVEK